MHTKTIRQSVTFEVGPHEVYEALMDSRKHSELTGSHVSMDRKVGGKFSAFDGYSEGANIELVPDKKIVQSWRASDWPRDHYSQATFELKEEGILTHLTFTQSGVPEDQYDDISQGWYDNYWEPMREMFSNKE